MHTGTIQNNAALLMLQQTAASSRHEETASGTGAIHPVVLVQVALQPTASQTQISEAMFSVNHADVTKLKLELIERTGKALGVNEDDYGSREEFASALSKAVGQLKLEGGQAAVADLAKSLGLDELGLSLDDILESACDPDRNDRLTQALSLQADNLTDGLQPPLPGPNELGLYGAFVR